MRKRRSALGNLIARQAAILLKVLQEGEREIGGPLAEIKGE
jgi:hypothetical protein